MNALFGSLTNDGLEEAQDRLGGYQPFDTDIYPVEIKAAYAGKSEGGAQSVTILADAGGREYRETFWVTNKKGENFFLNKQDKTKKVPLPGFTVVDDLCLIATGKPLCEQETEEKVVNIYDRDAGREVPKTVPMLTGLLGCNTVSLAIVRQLENKSKKNDATGEYESLAETRETNVVEKVFHTETKMSVLEAKNGAEKGTFFDSWLERNKGETRDKQTLKDGAAGQSGRPGQPPVAAGRTERKSLFGGTAAAA